MATPGAQVLLIHDFLPWGSAANEEILAANGIAYDLINTLQLAATNLENYDVVIVAGDQPSAAYSRLANRAAQIDAFVLHGGRLEFHAAGWGWNGGLASFVTLPGGMHIVQGFANVNHALLPGHPILAGVPEPLTGAEVSHARFTSIPAGADVIMGDDLSRPNLVSYRRGAGVVIAAGQTLEFGYQYGGGAGILLRNLIPFVVNGGLGWLGVDRTDGVVPPGGHLDITVTIDATGLNAGDNAADIRLTSNDPLRPEVVVPVQLHVTGTPNLVLQGRFHQLISTATYEALGATTQHALTLPRRPGTEGVLHVRIDGDYDEVGETATVSVEGSILGHLGERSNECAPDSALFDLSNAQLAQFGADSVVSVTLTNSPAVAATCFTNRHTVRLSYRDPSDLLDFGVFFIGGCRSETLEVVNDGTDSLRLGPFEFSQAGFTAVATNPVLAPNTTTLLIVTFCPLAPQFVAATLTLHSNDPHDAPVVVALNGTGTVPPDIAVSPVSLDVSLDAGTVATRTLTLSNTGGPLLWSTGDGANPSLAATLAALDAGYAAITSLIPNRFDFQGGVTGLSIDDGGGDMYDAGNFLRANQAGYLQYSDGVIRSSPDLGSQGRYFTRKYPGLFVLAADLDNVHSFAIEGNLGANGSGSLDGAVLDVPNSEYRAFVKRVFNAGDASVNHIVIVHENGGTHSYPASTDSDNHLVSGFNSRRIYYLLCAGTLGAYIDNTAIQAIVEAFLDALPLPPELVPVSPQFGELAGGVSVDLEAKFDARRLLDGAYPGQIVFASNDPDENPLVIPTLMHVRGIPDIAVVPDSLDLGMSFLGFARSDTLEVRNDGTAPLSVTNIGASPAVFSVTPGGFVLAPGGRRSLVVGFAPSASGSVTGAVTLASNDPDAPTFAVPLRGMGLVAPVFAVTPDSLRVEIPGGGNATRTLTVSNTGGSDLQFSLSLLSVADVPVSTATLPAGKASGNRLSSRAPAGYQARAPRPVSTPGAHTLLIEDLLPWGSEANQSILDANGIAYDLIGSAQLAGTDLGAYEVVIVPSDQPTSYYTKLAARAAQIDAFVVGGGRLEFHAAGWGANNGDASLVTLPGGMHIVQDFDYVNHVLVPEHPLVAGVPNPFTGSVASSARFTGVPAGARVLVTDDVARPNLVRYVHGEGLVVAAGQVLEYGFSFGEASGRILRNLIPYMMSGGLLWLTVDPAQGVVPPGESRAITVTFDAKGLGSGDYPALLRFENNDPLRSELLLHATLHVPGESTVDADGPPLRFELAPVTPTPARGTAHIAFTLTRPGRARASIYDVSGRRIQTLLDGPQAAGRHTLVWEGKDARGARRSAGVYLVRLETDEGQRTQRLVWIP